jgi:transcriptional regulator with XRE-family HTH domain
MTALRRRAPLGALMLAARRAHGLSLRDLATACASSPAHTSDVECGRRAPSEELLARICTALRVPVTERDHWYAAAGVLPQGLVDALLARPERWAAVREVLR